MMAPRAPVILDVVDDHRFSLRGHPIDLDDVNRWVQLDAPAIVAAHNGSLAISTLKSEIKAMDPVYRRCENTLHAVITWVRRLQKLGYPIPEACLVNPSNAECESYVRGLFAGQVPITLDRYLVSYEVVPPFRNVRIGARCIDHVEIRALVRRDVTIYLRYTNGTFGWTQKSPTRWETIANRHHPRYQITDGDDPGSFASVDPG